MVSAGMLSVTDIGLLTSLFPIMYGFSKFLSGVLVARFSAQALLAGGLAATALVNLTFGSASSITVFSALWAANGVLQVGNFG